ncbi:MAG TPA: hypothetical protein VJJ21_05110 [Candidatus Nanoarchaeia archaeon]|nr:hypothetical protein [Candidatus Nanoarchaeia archaeon]
MERLYLHKIGRNVRDTNIDFYIATSYKGRYTLDPEGGARPLLREGFAQFLIDFLKERIENKGDAFYFTEVKPDFNLPISANPPLGIVQLDKEEQKVLEEIIEMHNKLAVARGF